MANPLPIPAPGRFEAVMTSAQRANPDPTFEPCRDGVLRHDGGMTSLMTPEQVSDALMFYRRAGREAQDHAAFCTRMESAIWNARCEALDRCGAEAA